MSFVVKIQPPWLYVGSTWVLSPMAAQLRIREVEKDFGLKSTGYARDILSKDGNLITALEYNLPLNPLKWPSAIKRVRQVMSTS